MRKCEKRGKLYLLSNYANQSEVLEFYGALIPDAFQNCFAEILYLDNFISTTYF